MISYASANCAEILGVPSSHLIGELLADQLTLEQADAAGAPWEWLRDGENPHSARHRDGNRRWLATRTQMLTNSDGTAREQLCIARDVTATVLALRALRDSEQQFKHAFDDALAGMALSTTDGHLVRVNRAFAQLLGHRPDELTKYTVADLTPPSYRDNDDTNTRRLLDGTLAQVDVLKKYVHAAGHLVAVHVRATIVRSGTGEPYILAHILPDELDRARRSKPRVASIPKRSRSRV